MNQPQHWALIADIETTIRAVPGVTGIFRAGGPVSKAVDMGARIIGGQDGTGHLIRVDQSPEGVRIDVAIGVHATASAVETSSRVHAAISALCAAHHITPAEIQVTVVQIDDTTQMKGPQQ